MYDVLVDVFGGSVKDGKRSVCCCFCFCCILNVFCEIIYMYII